MFALNCMWESTGVDLKLSVRIKLKAALKWHADVDGVVAMTCPMLPVSSPVLVRSFILVDEIVWATIHQSTVYIFWLLNF